MVVDAVMSSGPRAAVAPSPSLVPPLSLSQLLVLLLVLLPDRGAHAARVLGVFPHHGYSHHAVFLPYLRALAHRGHDVHVVSNFETGHPRVRDVSVRGSMPMHNNNVSFPGSTHPALMFGLYGALSDSASLYHIARSTEPAFRLPAVRRLIDDPAAGYDLVVAEHFNSELPLGFAAKHRVPFVLLSSCPLLPWTGPLAGQPHQVAYRPSVLSGMSVRMDFGQRLVNALITMVSVAAFRLFHRPWSRRAIRDNFGVDVDLDAFAANVSLVLVNTHWSITGAVATVPALVEVGGMHIEPPKQLPAVPIYRHENYMPPYEQTYQY